MSLKKPFFFGRRAALSGAGSFLLTSGVRAATPRFAPVREEDLLVAFGHTSPVTDGGWTHAHDMGIQALKRTYPKLKTLYVESIPYSADATRIFRQFVAEGAQMVISTSNYGDFIRDVADRAPAVAFMECDGHAVSGNLGWYYITHWYASYAIGVAAARLSKTGRLGYVASFPVPSVYAGANATLLGARSVNPEATMRVISINSWFDPQAATEAGSALVDSGCDFLCGIMDDPGYLRVAQDRGVWAAMWNTDMRQFGPDAYVSSVTLDFAKFYIEQVGARIRGDWKPEARFLTLGAGVDRDAWGQRVPEVVRVEADAVRARMLGGWSPFQGPLYDSEGKLRVAEGHVMNDMELYNWNWQLQGVSGLG
ncbi:BMP family ABC transporter substrate-binding protein [Gluconobacter wancherniae]|uniref:BMP family ABC transporter substrate-binding protein n=1 Tax=Gluconobacter wancherniae NBRC 103581 TaxID=656744 RepID=A0A511B381_9PROT|nr:BMP family ABC transporter substrate-binding protein [Gluconobacter wancherniae]MBF0852466.1 BMP family ABC transporter substrate-binding protein [Gluconobacter wancherniae]GBD56825.1 BMP family ABC transporter substrate-binding protein [Gluconobacter wancherniae NBRC 103581]GBR64616.1 basic membrane lipoprotein [Gluconobacter wancherniae NBRC 103581]GEK92267.1 BMP family ABC transporter substrate-binding protein [Gluconobacter wancherniae NBRC 103581]